MSPFLDRLQKLFSRRHDETQSIDANQGPGPHPGPILPPTLGNKIVASKDDIDVIMLEISNAVNMQSLLEVIAARDLIYARYTTPIAVSLHNQLSKYFTSQEQYDLALEEVNLEIQSTTSLDPQLRRSLILLGQKQVDIAAANLQDLEKTYPGLASQRDVLMRKVRLLRERWELSAPPDLTALNDAVQLCNQAVNVLPNDYYPMINFAELSFLKSVYVDKLLPDKALTDAQSLFQKVITLCEEAQKNEQGYWYMLALAEAYVGINNRLEAHHYYQLAAQNPTITLRDWNSALGSLHRILTALNDQTTFESDTRQLFRLM